jgi:Uma2 family endonuclease
VRELFRRPAPALFKFAQINSLAKTEGLKVVSGARSIIGKELLVATAPTRLMTFAEFERLPDPKSGHYELHHGEVVEVAPPKHGHKLRQRRLRLKLESVAGDSGIIETELAYRPTPDYEYWVADVAFVSHPRWETISEDGCLEGAPELVIDVLSPSNTSAQMKAKRKLCLENGSREFWEVDMDYREVEVSAPDGRTVIFTAGQIPLFFARGSTIRVDDIFG